MHLCHFLSRSLGMAHTPMEQRTLINNPSYVYKHVHTYSFSILIICLPAPSLELSSVIAAVGACVVSSSIQRPLKQQLKSFLFNIYNSKYYYHYHYYYLFCFVFSEILLEMSSHFQYATRFFSASSSFASSLTAATAFSSHFHFHLQ